MLCFVPCCEVQQIFFWLSKGRRWAIRTLNFKEVSYESGTLHNHCSDNLEPISKDNSESVPCCEAQQIFFPGFPCEGVRLSELGILKKSAMEVLFCTIIVVKTSNLIRKISLNMLCSVPCCEVQQIFALALHGKALGYQNFEF